MNDIKADYPIEVAPGGRFGNFEQAQAMTDTAMVPALIAFIRQRINEGIYKVIDGRVVKCDNGNKNILQEDCQNEVP